MQKNEPDGSNEPQVFLSSVFNEEIEGAWTELPLRQSLIDLSRSLPIQLWAYELFWPKGSERGELDADTIIDRCFSAVSRCDLFVFLLTKRHGTGVKYLEPSCLASYLEMELFAAAMLQKPVLVLHEDGYEPEQELHDVLEILKKKFDPSQYVTGAPEKLIPRFREVCSALVQTKHDPRFQPVTKLPDYLCRIRSHARIQDELADPSLLFLDANLASSQKIADLDQAQELIEQVVTGTRDQPPMTHGSALLRLWASMRELMDQNSSATNDPLVASVWDRVMGLWASHASWFGLHGHLWMGPLSSVQMQTHLRHKFADEPSFRSATDVREPLGARASAIYSIAQRVQSRKHKIRQFKLVSELATRAVSLDEDDLGGARLIRGHASMQLSRLGHFWKIKYAQVDFQDTLNARESHGASGGSIGEAKVALGCSLAIGGQRRRGIHMIQEGIGSMRGDHTASGRSFLARGLRSLERVARIAGYADIAQAAQQEREAMATTIGAMDQMRTV